MDTKPKCAKGIINMEQKTAREIALEKDMLASAKAVYNARAVINSIINLAINPYNLDDLQAVKTELDEAQISLDISKYMDNI